MWQVVEKISIIPEEAGINRKQIHQLIQIVINMMRQIKQEQRMEVKEHANGIK